MPHATPVEQKASRRAAQAMAVKILGRFGSVLSPAERSFVISRPSASKWNFHLTQLVALEGQLESRW